MKRVKTDKQNNRRMSGALLCAALLHFALFTAIDLFVEFPRASNVSKNNVSNIISISFSPAQKNELPQKENTELDHTNKKKERTPRNTITDKNQIDETKAADAQITDTSKTDSPGNTTRKNPTIQNDGSEQQTADSPVQFGAQLEAIGSEPALAQTETTLDREDFTRYLQKLLEKNRHYPLAARRRNIEGAVEFFLHVDAEGGLSELVLAGSSGSRILDKAAEDLVQRVFPVDYPLQSNMKTTIRIIYRLQDV